MSTGEGDDDKRNHNIRNFRFHEYKKLHDPLYDKQFYKDIETSLKTNKPFICGVFE